MREYYALIKKEILENIRNYKLLILILVFFVLGTISPITAKFTPDLMRSFMPEGFDIKIPEPIAIDAWAQYFKNISQMGMFILALVFSGIMVTEFQRESLTIPLSKGLDRYKLILSKLIVSVAIWTLIYIIALISSWLYTIYFWGNNIEFILIFKAVKLPYLFGIFIISANILGGVLFKNIYGVLLFTATLVVLQFILGIKPEIMKILPIYMVSKSFNIIKEEVLFSDFRMSIGINFLLIILMNISSIVIIKRKNI